VNCGWANEIFYGGARGGGKTDGTLGKFLVKKHQFGRYVRGIIFRRTLPQIEAVIQRAKELYEPHGAIYTEKIRPSGIDALPRPIS
jgi:hypothetical protein